MKFLDGTTINGDAVQTAANKNVNNGIAGLDSGGKIAWAQFPGPKITVGTSAPSLPNVGDIWVDTN
jgi:hypothetical protein